MSSDARRVLFLEGNIGSGKSTLLRYCEENKLTVGGRRVVCVREPVDEWRRPLSESGTSIFDLYYADKSRYALPFQASILVSRIAQLSDLLTAPDTRDCWLLVERSPCAGRMFMDDLRQKQLISDTDAQLARMWFDWCEDAFVSRHSAGTVYLRVDPAVCLERIRGRARPGEEAIDASVLEGLHSMHESFVAGLREGRALCLDGSRDSRDAADHARRIAAFLLEM